jgi:hypothetical protein
VRVSPRDLEWTWHGDMVAVVKLAPGVCLFAFVRDLSICPFAYLFVCLLVCELAALGGWGGGSLFVRHSLPLS